MKDKSERYKINSTLFKGKEFKGKELFAFEIGYMTAIMDMEDKK